MKKDYFKNVFKALQKRTENRLIGLNFITLKSYEYWIRTLRCTKKYPDASDSIAILPKESALRILEKIVKHFKQLNKDEDKCSKNTKQSPNKRKIRIDNKLFDVEESDKPELYQDRQKTITKIREVLKNNSSIDAIRNVTGQNLYRI